MESNVILYEHGTNKKLDEIYLHPAYIPAVGEYLILDDDIRDGWEDKMYLVKSVTALLPRVKRTYSSFGGISSEEVSHRKVLHIQKYNPNQEKEYWDNVVKRVKHLRETREDAKND